jgi:broad specificity phosphatase PhoE
MSTSPRPPQVVLVRHGETEWSRTGQHTGLTDLPLLEEGRRMGRTLAGPLGAWSFAAVWTSPLRRAEETCVLAGYGDAAHTRAGLREWDYGAYEGRTGVQIRAERPGWNLWEHGVPEGETLAQVAARADAVIAEARALQGDVLLFSHGHLLRVLAVRWLGLPASCGGLLALGTASISVLGWDSGGERPVLERWNDTTHWR